MQVPESGGTATPVTELDVARGDRGHRFPHFLPDGRTFLFAVGSQAAVGFNPGGSSGSGIYAALARQQDRQTGAERRRLSFYVEPGFLMFVRQQTLMAIPFDTKTLEVSGTPQPVAERVRGGLFSVASNGTIVYRSGGDATVQLSWFMRDGRRRGRSARPGPIARWCCRRADAVSRSSRATPGFYVESDGDLWLMDLTTGVHSRLTNDPAFDADPSWSPDERSLVFTSSRLGRHAVVPQGSRHRRGVAACRYSRARGRR